MGTRHLIRVTLNGDYRIAQYGQFDGYPTGVGADLQQELESVTETLESTERFVGQVAKCYPITGPQMNDLIDNAEGDGFDIWPQFDRTTSAKIISLVANGVGEDLEGYPVYLQPEFADDTLFCEYVWDINLDDQTVGMIWGHPRRMSVQWTLREFLITDMSEIEDMTNREVIQEFL